MSDRRYSYEHKRVVSTQGKNPSEFKRFRYNHDELRQKKI